MNEAVDRDAEALEDQFSYHAPVGNQLDRYQAIRDAAKLFARIVIGNCPQSADRSAAIRKIREAAMTANAAIAITETLHAGQTRRNVHRIHAPQVAIENHEEQA